MSIPALPSVPAISTDRHNTDSMLISTLAPFYRSEFETRPRRNEPRCIILDSSAMGPALSAMTPHVTAYLLLLTFSVSALDRVPDRSITPDPTACPGHRLPQGYGLRPYPDTPSAFETFKAFQDAATKAPIPSGYRAVFTNLDASFSGSHPSNQYLGYTQLQQYDADECAAQCSSMSRCIAINLYFERAPLVDPNPQCKNPPSTTLIKCAFWGEPITIDGTCETGQWRGDFQIVIAGSNSYTQHTYTDPRVPGYKVEWLDHAAIDAPLDCHGNNTYLCLRSFNTTCHDPARCAAACAEWNTDNSKGASPRLCHYFNSYLENVDGEPRYQHCALYTQAWYAAQATNMGQIQGGDTLSILSSMGFVNATGNFDACL
jgi:hypothetical protein